MDAKTLTIKDVFSKDIRYVIPMFQRPYVWNRLTHWEPLWEDVRSTADRYLRNLSRSEHNDPVEAEQATAPHFLGAIVVDVLSFGTGDVEARHVIDGQQRLTTLQLLLDASQEVVEELSSGREARLLKKLVSNDPDVATNPNHRFKVWPTNIDRDAFRASMENGVDPAAHRGTPIADAHAHFKGEVSRWLTEVEGELRTQRIKALTVVLHSRLQLVVIDLEPHDNAQVIFETLNARGTPLLASDLIKNHLLQTAEGMGLDVRVLYEENWQRFDQPQWRKDQNQGRIKRPRIDAFLDYYLELRTMDEVSPHSVFPTFRTYLADHTHNLPSIVDDIVRLSDVYDSLSDADHPTHGAFLRRWHLLETQVSTPLLLWLFANEGQMDNGQLAVATASLESFLVRRMLCRLTTKDYNHLFFEALQELDGGDPHNAGDRLRAFFARQTAESRYWPSDSAVARAAVTAPLYRRLKRKRLRMLLEALENDLRTDRSEEPFTPSRKVTIEHLIPQAWTPSDWPLPDPDHPQAAEQRTALIHVLGNLTLVNDKLNPALSNGPWEAKRPALTKHSVLRLNNEILEQPGAWTDRRVTERGIELAKRIVRIWPASDTESVDYAGLVGLQQAGSVDSTMQELDPPDRSSIMLQLLEADLLEPDELMIWRRPKMGIVHEAHLQPSGMIEIEGGELFSSPSGAAEHLAGVANNGWQVWRVPRLDDRTLSEIRDELH